jgi:hypothetical protein
MELSSTNIPTTVVSLPEFYFVAKCDNSKTLEKACNENIWAIPVRKSTSTQPYEILNEAFKVIIPDFLTKKKKGIVYLLVSVSNTSRFQGYAKMEALAEVPGL